MSGITQVYLHYNSGASGRGEEEFGGCTTLPAGWKNGEI